MPELKCWIVYLSGETEHIVFAASEEEAWEFLRAKEPKRYAYIRECGGMYSLEIRPGVAE